MVKAKTKQQLTIENEELRARLQEMEDTLEAIRSGAVDAIVTSSPAGDRVFTLEGADHAYHLMVETMNEGAVTVLTDGTILYGNRQFGQMAGASDSGIVGRRFHEFVSTSDHPVLDTILATEGPNCPKAEIRLYSEAAAEIPAQIAASPIQLGGTKALTLVVTDLSEQRRYEEIVAAEKLSRLILQQAHEAIAVCIDGCIVRANRALYEICGSFPLMQRFDLVIPLCMSESKMFSVAMPETGKTIHNQEVRYQRPDGKIFDLILNAGPLAGKEDKVLGSLISLLDITERKRAEEALKEAKESLEQKVRERTMDLQNIAEQLDGSRGELRKLASELVMAEERERKRIAGVLHDEIAQTLAAARMRVDMIQGIPSDQEERLKEAKALLMQSILETRSLMTDIGNPLLFDMGVKAACESLADRLTKMHRVRIHCDIGEAYKYLDPDIKTILYQLIRELLNNVVKHSRAKNAHVAIDMENGKFRVKVTDDGVGFDTRELGVPTFEGGFGLYSIRERLIAIDGTLRIESAPGAGTTVTAIVPATMG
jgi:PAS domain S-box-containing protein